MKVKSVGMSNISGGSSAGFWSYTHEDDTLDGGSILALSADLKHEYNLLAGEPLELFVDRDGISWGEEWRQRIDSALICTNFFIPIITPRYFTRPECRRELLEFSAKATALGVSELLMPILYVETPGLSEESSDEAVALVARTQYVDWRSNRLLEPRSGDYRRAVNVLATRLLGIARKIADKQLDHELNADIDSNGVDGITDIVEQISLLLPDWLEAVLGGKTTHLQMRVTVEQFIDRLNRMEKKHSPASAILATQIRMAREVLPLMERGLNDARVYSSRSMELDPLMSTLARLINEYPDGFPLIISIRQAIDEAMESIRNKKPDGPDFVSVADYFAQFSHLGRIFQKCTALSIQRDQVVLEGNGIVQRWDVELRNPGLPT